MLFYIVFLTFFDVLQAMTDLLPLIFQTEQMKHDEFFISLSCQSLCSVKHQGDNMLQNDQINTVSQQIPKFHS